ncbi:MAG: hypothetical protein V9F00_12405 [Nocardioides sp.]
MRLTVKLVIDGVLVPAERIEGGDLHPVAEHLAALGEPRLVRLPGASGDQVQQASLGAAVRISGQVDHPGQLLGAAPAVLDRLGRHVVPHVLVDPEDGHPVEAGRVLVHRLQQRLDRLPHRAPPGAELAADPVHRGVLAADLLDRPPARSRRQRRARRGDALVLLHERRHRAPRFGADPPPLTPDDPHRSAHRRGVDQRDRDTAVAVRDDPAGRAAHDRRLGLHRDHERAAVVAVNPDHVQPVQPDQHVTTLAVAAQSTAARRRLTHRRGPRFQKR